MSKLTAREFIENVLSEATKPLTGKGIYDEGKKKGLELDKEGKSADIKIGEFKAIMYSNIRNSKNPIFMTASRKPTTFWLKKRENKLPPSEQLQQKMQESQEKEVEEKYKFKERELHPILVSFLNNDDNFNIRAKTIYHEKCIKNKKGKGIWNYPDIVGVSFPFDNEEMKEETLNLLQNINQIQYKLYSFELKIIINFSNLKECYFQAVSNSSWANEGYLVVFDIDEEIIDELKRLNASFGIGVIQLDIEELKPKVILPSSQRELDIETLNMLVKESPDFSKFIEDINRHIKAKAGKLGNITDNFDKVFDNDELEKYIEDKKIVKN
ncbi:hypothetical protein [Brachyspira sp.]|uniref:hypothetical protein n=1 Tax=Brachyspira sp. TaxID=1977261 RepID=UPI003D7E62FB